MTTYAPVDDGNKALLQVDSGISLETRRRACRKGMHFQRQGGFGLTRRVFEASVQILWFRGVDVS